MRRTLRWLTLAATAALVWTPTPARAETWVAPFIGTTFGATSSDANSKVAFGANVGGLSEGKIFGAEIDFGYVPSPAGDKSLVGSNYLLDFTGDVLIAAPQGLIGKTGVRPFATAGLGLIRTHVEGSGSVPSASDNESAYTLGGGAMGLIGRHAGLRGDVRYFRTVNHPSAFTASSGSFYYWRASVAVVIH